MPESLFCPRKYSFSYLDTVLVLYYIIGVAVLVKNLNLTVCGQLSGCLTWQEKF